MKVLTILGTRPEIIRLSRIIPLLDKYNDHILVYTNQNYDQNLSQVFFDALKIRQPDVFFDGKSESFGQEASRIFVQAEKIFLQEKPDRILILGDTNSGLAAIIAKRMMIPVFHMEAGNRCFSDLVPEEVNRRLIDQCSEILLPYTWQSKENLISEGYSGQKIFVTGNPIFEVLKYYDKQIEGSEILKTMNLRKNKYFLLTLHRAENVNNLSRLSSFVAGLEKICEDFDFPVVCSLHPHTAKKLSLINKKINEKRIILSQPFSFFDFVFLEKNACCILSDSGTVQEEACIFHVPNVILRDQTERPEIIENGSGILSGCDPQRISQAVKLAMTMETNWTVPAEYQAPSVSQSVVKIINRPI